MKTLAGGCRVYSPQDGQISTVGNWVGRTVISRDSGAKRITQTASEYTPGVSPAIVNPNAEEVLYVTAGAGVAHVNGFAYPLRPGCAVFIPPGAVYHIENPSAEKLHLVSCCCPEDPERHIVETPV